jgi:threonine/homoserine/homoserine lactone efflux protein
VLPTGHLPAFVLISFALIVVPGPNVLFVISRSLTLGRVAGVGSAVGGQIGVYAQVAAVAFGIGAIVERSVVVFTAIKLAGAAYLIFLGVQAVRHRRSLGAALHAEMERKTMGTIVRDGIVVGVSNPKAIVFFAAVLPQFVTLRPAMCSCRCCCWERCSSPSRWCATAPGRWPPGRPGRGSPARHGGWSWWAAPAAWS